MEANTTESYRQVAVLTFRDWFLDHKTEDPFVLKMEKKQHTREKAYVVEWGGAKEISPKGAMHLVVVL